MTKTGDWAEARRDRRSRIETAAQLGRLAHRADADINHPEADALMERLITGTPREEVPALHDAWQHGYRAVDYKLTVGDQVKLSPLAEHNLDIVDMNGEVLVLRATTADAVMIYRHRSEVFDASLYEPNARGNYRAEKVAQTGVDRKSRVTWDTVEALFENPVAAELWATARGEVFDPVCSWGHGGNPASGCDLPPVPGSDLCAAHNHAAAELDRLSAEPEEVEA